MSDDQVEMLLAILQSISESLRIIVDAVKAERGEKV